MIKFRFQDLEIWNMAIEIADELIAISDSLDQRNYSRFAEQLRAAALSVSNNIAEGSGRGSAADNRRFAKIARGFLFEAKHWLRRAYKRKLFSENEITSLKKSIDELTPKLSSYINSFDV